MVKSTFKKDRKPVRVLVVDDHPVVREGLAAQILSQPDLEVCGEAADLAGALALFEATRPDVAIIDISLKNGNGIDLIKRIKLRDDKVRILVWSMYPESLYAERALRAGAHGYLNKGEATHKLLEALRTVLAGKVYVSPELNDNLLGRIVGGSEGRPSAVGTLSDRELETFELIGQGLTTEKIAEKMHVSPKTVETYRIRIKEKLGFTKAIEVIQRATQWVLENG